MIKRKSTEATSQVKDAVAQLQTQVHELKRQYDELWKTQHQILYVLSRYLRAGGAQNIRIPGCLNRQQSVEGSRKRPRLFIEPAPLEFSTPALDSKSSGSLDMGDPYVIEDDDATTWQAIGDLQGLINQIPSGREVLNETPLLMQLPKSDDGVDPSDVAEYVAASTSSRVGSNNNPRALQLLLPAPPPPTPVNNGFEAPNTTAKPLSPSLFTDSDSISLPRSTDTSWIPTELDYSNPNLFANDTFDPQTSLDFTQTPFLSNGLDLGDDLTPLPETVPSPPSLTLLSDDDNHSMTRSRTSPTSNHRSPTRPPPTPSPTALPPSPPQSTTTPLPAIYSAPNPKLSTTTLLSTPTKQAKSTLLSTKQAKSKNPLSTPTKFAKLNPPLPTTLPFTTNSSPFSCLPFSNSSSLSSLPSFTDASSLSSFEVPPYLPPLLVGGQPAMNSNRAVVSKSTKVIV